jgi:hypothetical protein
MMPMQGSLSIERMCELMRVSRTSFYRSLQQREPEEESMEVRPAIQRGWHWSIADATAIGE